MKFCKLLNYDLKNGILKKWYLYVGTFAIACVFTGNFYYQYHSYDEHLGGKLTSTNILLYLYQGKEPVPAEWGSAFAFPVVWILIFLFSAFLTLDYPMKSLSGHGIQVISRIGKRTYWWGTKCIWIAGSTLIYFGIWYLTVIGVCKVTGADISLGYSQAVNSELLEMELESLTHEQEIMLLIILPVMTALSLNFLQLCLGLFIDKTYCFLLVAFLLFTSTYFKNPIAIGNFAMVKRSVYCMEEGMSTQMGLVMKMKKNHKIKIVVGIVSCVIICSAYGWRYQTVNAQLKNPEIQEYSMGDWIEFQDDFLINYTMKGYALKVNQAEILTYEQFLNKYHVEDEYTYVPDKIYDVEVTLKNINAEDTTGINLSEFYVQGVAVCAGIDTNLCSVANPDFGGAYTIALRTGAEIIVHMPFALYEENFSDDVWDDLNHFDMNFVATLYPTKKVIHMSVDSL